MARGIQDEFKNSRLIKMGLDFKKANKTISCFKKPWFHKGFSNLLENPRPNNFNKFRVLSTLLIPQVQNQAKPFSKPVWKVFPSKRKLKCMVSEVNQWFSLVFHSLHGWASARDVFNLGRFLNGCKSNLTSKF